MRKSKIIKVDSLELTIKELRVRDIYELFSGDDGKLSERFGDLLDRCSDIKQDQLLDMTPSDIQQIWEAFEEVNSAFLDMAAKVGLDDLPTMLSEILREQFQLSLSQVTEQ